MATSYKAFPEPLTKQAVCLLSLQRKLRPVVNGSSRWGTLLSRGSIRVGLFCSLYLFHIGSSSRYVQDYTDCCHVLVFGGIRQGCYCTAYAAIRALCISSTFWDVLVCTGLPMII